MCLYTHIRFSCGHLRHLVQSFCSDYWQTWKLCSPPPTYIPIGSDENKCGLSCTRIPDEYPTSCIASGNADGILARDKDTNKYPSTLQPVLRSKPPVQVSRKRSSTAALRDADGSNKRAQITDERSSQGTPPLTQWEISPELLFGCVLDVLRELTQSPSVGVLIKFVKKLTWPQRHLLFCAAKPLQCRDIYDQPSFTDSQLYHIVYLYQYHTSTPLSTIEAQRVLTSILQSLEKAISREEQSNSPEAQASQGTWVSYLMLKLKKSECHNPLFDVLEPNELEQLAIGYRTMIGSCTWSELDEIYQRQKQQTDLNEAEHILLPSMQPCPSSDMLRDERTLNHYHTKLAQPSTVVALTSEEVGLLYTFARLSSVAQHTESVGELVDELDPLDVPSLAQLEDESFEFVVRTSYLPELREKFCTRFPGCDITVYDPTEPTETDKIHYGYDQAKARAVNVFLKRKKEMMSGSHASVAYYSLRARDLEEVA